MLPQSLRLPAVSCQVKLHLSGNLQILARSGFEPIKGDQLPLSVEV